MKKYILVLLMFNVAPQFLMAQKTTRITEFSTETDVYLQQLDLFLNKSKSEEFKLITKQITKAFNNSTISKLNQERIIGISNRMLKQKLRPSPYFKTFFNVVLMFNQKDENKNLFDQWIVVYDTMLTSSTSKRLMIFCDFTTSFIQNKTLRNSRSVRWYADYTTFSFKEDFGIPYIHFPSPINLNCSNDNGSFSIKNTIGDFWILTHEFSGENGKLDWTRRGFSSDSIYAVLKNYKLDVKKPHFIADSAIFYNKYLFDKPIQGLVEDKVVPGKSAKSYPLFRSENTNVVLDDIFPDVDYKGGYVFKGKEFIADGGDDASARILIKKNGKVILIANANRFSIKDNEISSTSAAIKLFFDEDSIYHPSVQFSYDKSKRKLQLYRDGKGVSGSPIINSYHQLTMDAELLEWQIDDEFIYLGSTPATSVSSVQFESIANYQEAKFHELQGIDAINPLMLVNKYVKKSGNNEFSARDFAHFSGYPEIQIQHYLMNLANKGFLYYNIAQHRVTVLEKLNNYVNAKLQKGDYDVIRFSSNIKQTSGSGMIVNSSINLNSKDLVIQGVGIVSLSDSQRVYIQPYNGKIELKKNRDFQFDGKISAGNGRFILFGKQFNFTYDQFKVDLNQIDSVQLSVPKIPIVRDMYGNEKLVRVKTVLEAVTGYLRIDHPNNKSGLRKDSFPEYPIFTSFEDSYAYYDRPGTFNGVYNRDNFSFHLQPFEIDSLENFTGKGLRFPGTFESANIFPIFDDTLTLQKDYSLGFDRVTPNQGFEIYGGKAHYFNDIHLSHEGLKGKGIFEYLTSVSTSDEIYFFPDSTALFTKEFTLNKVEEGIEFPSVKNNETFALYYPYNDKFYIHKIEDEFNFYDSQATFNGDILLKPSGLTGGGVMTLDKAEMESDLFSYNAKWFASDTADLKVFTDLGGISFQSKNLRTHIDLYEKTGDFYSNGKGSYVDLPDNKYICFIDKLHWDMKEKMLTLGDQEGTSKGTKFVSVHPGQDSLSFVAKTSTYDLQENIINVFGVNEILVADVAIYPSEDGFSVEKNAFIPTISGARILANVHTKYHEFTNANVNIDGGNKYTASADYTYVDAQKVEQHIFFRQITVNEDTSTIAIGEVDNEDPFKIGSKFNFKGNVNLMAEDRYLTFDGYLNLNNKCDLITQDWVKFRSEINPKLIRIKLDSVLRNEDKDRLATGILMNLDSTHMYTAFLSPKERSIDVEIIKANTYLRYDKRLSSFIMEGKDSIANLFIINENTCKSSGEGAIDLNLDFGQLSVKSAGFIERDEKNNNTELQVFLMLDFMFEEKAMEVMAKDIYEAFGEEEYVYGEFYSRTLARLVGKEKSEEMIIDVESTDEFSSFPNELNKTLVFTDLTLVWDDKKQSYINKGKIGVGNIFENQLNSIMDGWIKLSKKGIHDELYILLKTEYGDIYYFEYKNNVMSAYSTNDDFNNIIIETKAKKRQADRGRNKQPYRYVYCSEEKMERFEKEMRKRD